MMTLSTEYYADIEDNIVFFTGAIKSMRDELFTTSRGDRSNVNNIGVVMTDGRSNDEMQTWEEAMKTRAARVSQTACQFNIMHVIPYSCFSACDVLTFCDEMA